MRTKLKVVDMKCVDDDSKTRGVSILCASPQERRIDAPQASYVVLIFDKAIPHEKTDDLMHLLEKMKLSDVIVETPEPV